MRSPTAYEVSIKLGGLSPPAIGFNLNAVTDRSTQRRIHLGQTQAGKHSTLCALQPIKGSPARITSRSVRAAPRPDSVLRAPNKSCRNHDAMHLTKDDYEAPPQ